MASQTSPEGVTTAYAWDVTKGLLKNVSVSGHQADYSYDTMDRLTKVAGKAAVNGTETDVQVQYTYDRDRLTKITHNGFDYTFAYDGFGNRKSVSIAGKAAVSHDYTYDAQGQLTREYDPDKKLYLGYQYDAGGNLTEVCSYPAGAEGGPEGTGTVLKRFAYGSTWKDQLASVTMDGKTRNFTYDANGNLLSDGKYTYSWTKGSLLEKVTGDGLEAVYTYDASGIWTSKKVNGTTTEYLTAGGSVLSEKKNGVWQQVLIRTTRTDLRGTTMMKRRGCTI